MKRLAIALLAVIPVSALVALGLYTYPRFVAQPPVITYAQPLQQAETVKLNADTIFELVNAERVKNGLQPLIRDARLDATAKYRADDMVARNYFSHFDPVTGEKMIDKLDAGCYFSENIVWIKYATPQEDNQEAVDWWMNSESHRNALLKQEYTNSGIAITEQRVVQLFCTR